MANYYTDHPELEFYLDHPLMKRVVELREHFYEDKDKFDDAPVDYEDCIENYKRVLEIMGDLAANVIAPNSEAVDLEGPRLENGRMIYASKTFENLDAIRKAGLRGQALRRPQLPQRALQHAERDSFRGGFQLPEHLEPAVLRRHSLRVRKRRTAPALHPPHLRGRNHEHGSHRARCRIRPSARDAQGHLR